MMISLTGSELYEGWARSTLDLPGVNALFDTLQTVPTFETVTNSAHRGMCEWENAVSKMREEWTPHKGA